MSLPRDEAMWSHPLFDEMCSAFRAHDSNPTKYVLALLSLLDDIEYEIVPKSLLRQINRGADEGSNVYPCEWDEEKSAIEAWAADLLADVAVPSAALSVLRVKRCVR